MNNEQFCQNCRQQHDCRKIYQRMAEFKGPSVAAKVFIAFLLPLLVLVGCLAVSQEVLAKVIAHKDVRTVVSFVSAVAATFVVILLVRVINSRPTRKSSL